MRILHLGKFYPPDIGGMETYLADLAAAQRDQGFQVAVLVHGRPRPDDPDWLLRVPVAFTLIYAPFAPGFRRALRRMLQKFKPDVLHLHLPNNAAFWALTLHAALDVPWVIHWHADVLTNPKRRLLRLAYRLYRPFEQALLKRAERIVVTSPDYLAASEPLSGWNDKCHVVPLGIAIHAQASIQQTEPEKSVSLPWPPGHFRLLSIGRLTHYKGFETLIRAAAGLPRVHLVIAGAGELQQALSALIESLTPPGQAPRISLLGSVSESTKRHLLKQCDAFCLASCERTEAFGIAVIEAMYHARPCLVSDLPGSGLPWLVRTAGAGRTVPVGDVLAWQRAIVELQEHPNQAMAWGAGGRLAVETRFSIQHSSAQISAVYRLIYPEPAADTKQPLIVIPARNEAGTIAQVISSLRAVGWSDILVVNDQSNDDTAKIARAAGARVLSPVLPMGAWGAMQTGIRYAVQKGYNQVVTLDADGQHEPACVAKLLAAARHADVVIGAHPQRGSLARRIAWRYFRFITGLPIEDLTSGFRCYNRDACQLLSDDEATLLEYQDLGVLLLLRQAGLRMVEVPVEMYPRTSGPSRIFSSWGKVARYMLESTLLCLARWHPKHLIGR